MRKKQLPGMRSMISSRILLGNYAVVILGLLVTSIFVFNFLKDEIGKTRVDILRQISDLNQQNMNIMRNAMDNLYGTVQGAVDENGLGAFDGGQAGQAMKNANDFFANMDVSSSVDIIVKGGTVYSSDGNLERTKALKQTVWYTYLISGSRTESWNMNFPDREDPKGIVLAYGKTLYNKSGEPSGIVIISISQETLYKSYESALTENNTIYIMDEAGIVISHSNPKLIGFTFYYMPTFEETTVPFNSYVVKNGQNRPVLLSNYHNEKNNWTFVEELDLTSKLKSYSRVLFGAVGMILAVTLVMLGLDLVFINKITNPLSGFAKDIKNIELDVHKELSEVRVQKQYSEINILTESFNRMLSKIQELIRDIKDNERKKREVEFDFLQAQIQPHFLHNTLLTLKSLIVLGEKDKAVLMLDDFNALLRIPLMEDRQFVALYQEVELVMHYMAIMEYRFDKGFILRTEIPDQLKNILIPRMILQPVVANAVFHGFAEKEAGGIVVVSAYEQGDNLHIVIADNGEGMSKEQIEKIMSGERNVNSHHGVGLQNVKSRIRLIYGEDAKLNVKSTIQMGTEVILVFPDYRAVYREPQETEREE